MTSGHEAGFGTTDLVRVAGSSPLSLAVEHALATGIVVTLFDTM